ncbi:adenylate/guanylate cyclase domain-containing protein [Variovorax sp. LjRoot290]|uniref:adenylate/guanylate cyclase domain-containing protein n=1 Tax=unclassified Variovorax TaxID=663243 RepID=UPI003ECF77AA
MDVVVLRVDRACGGLGQREARIEGHFAARQQHEARIATGCLSQTRRSNAPERRVAGIGDGAAGRRRDARRQRGAAGEQQYEEGGQPASHGFGSEPHRLEASVRRNSDAIHRAAEGPACPSSRHAPHAAGDLEPARVDCRTYPAPGSGRRIAAAPNRCRIRQTMFSSTLTRGARIRSFAVLGTFVAAIVFFGSERLMRDELPRLIPGGELSAVRAPRMRVRTRMLVAFLLLGLLPLAVLSMAALTRADALRTADAATAAAIIHNLNLVIIVLALGGVVVSVALALLVAASVARPLSEVQAAMAQVQRGGLDARCEVVSNDEIGAVAEGFNAMVRGLREREAIRETFGRYVSPEVRDEILAGRVSGAGVQRDVTILFADLRDFTPWVEASPPAEVVADLNAYFSEMDAAIRAHGGLVLQFIGDEIEAVFGAPIEDVRHADAAVAAAREMGQRLDAWNSVRRSACKTELRHGIGIHTGTVIAGNIGSTERMSYALVGDAVNLASRIQALNKDFGTHMLVSGATRARLS